MLYCYKEVKVLQYLAKKYCKLRTALAIQYVKNNKNALQTTQSNPSKPRVIKQEAKKGIVKTEKEIVKSEFAMKSEAPEIKDE